MVDTIELQLLLELQDLLHVDLVLLLADEAELAELLIEAAVVDVVVVLLEAELLLLLDLLEERGGRLLVVEGSAVS